MTVDRERRVRVVARLHAPPILAAASLIVVGLMLAGCGSADKFARKVDPKYGVPSSPRVVEAGQPVPKGGGTYRVGKPYVVGGRNYVPEANAGYAAEGQASWYGDAFHGRLTANGEVFDISPYFEVVKPTLQNGFDYRRMQWADQAAGVRANDRMYRPAAPKYRTLPTATDARGADQSHRDRQADSQAHS